jgi:uracil-DNA glycosylase family 4
MAKYGFRRDEFGIINRVQCRPMDGSKNGKPSPLEMHHCVKWVRKFIKCLDPKGIILLGNYAKSLIDGKNGGIEQLNARKFLVPDTLTERDIYCVFSVHPAVGIYDGRAGIEKLEKAIQRFKEICS